MRFEDLERLPSHRFRYDNSVRMMVLIVPCYRDTASGYIVIEKPWTLLGWSDSLEPALMRGREGQIALMMWHPDEGEAWEHYPLFDDDDRHEAVFVSR